jgi:transposase
VSLRRWRREFGASSGGAVRVSVASAVRWSQRRRRPAESRPGKQAGHRKPILLPEREWLLARMAAEPDLTLRGLLAELAERG